jgi:hypothetical protein
MAHNYVISYALNHAESGINARLSGLGGVMLFPYTDRKGGHGTGRTIKRIGKLYQCPTS